MTEREGVIKYHLDFQSCALDLATVLAAIPSQQGCQPEHCLSLINTARHYCLLENMIGQDPSRYAGYGFGNLSVRMAKEAISFLISGTQTGHLSTLALADCALVTSALPSKNTLVAMGSVEPSSESMTHYMIYQSLPWVHAVVHVHCPEIWHCADQLRLPFTASSIPYGTPEMASAVASLCLNEYGVSPLAAASAFSMKGHEDGVVVMGASMASAIDYLMSLKQKSTTLFTHRSLSGRVL